MFTKTLTAAIFVAVIALALVTAGTYASLASAVKTGNSVTGSKSSGHNGNKNADNSGDAQTGIGVSNKDLKKLADCQSNAAGNVGLTQSQVDDCYNQVFPQGPSSQQQQQQQQPTSMQGPSSQQQQPTSMQGQQVLQMLREGFPFR